MAYSNSRASYPAWTDLCVEEMVLRAEQRDGKMESMWFPTEQDAKRARFQIYGMIKLRERELTEAYAGDPEAIRRERARNNLARHWTLTVKFSPAELQYELAFENKNDWGLTQQFMKRLDAAQAANTRKD